MTKREICERLLKIHNALEDIEPHIGDVFHEVEELLLDLAAPDDHFADLGKKGATLPDISVAAPETELGDKAWYEICPWRIRGKSPFGVECSPLLCSHCARKPEKKEPPVLIYEENGEKVPCPVCGEPAAPIKNKPGVVYCKRCGLCPKGEPKRKEGEIEFCWCQKCYAKADVVHDPFGDGENWSYCKKCGVSFRLKLREEDAK